MMHELPRQKLKELILEYGHSLCDDPRRCEALLRDYCGQYCKEVSVLVNAIKENVPAALLSSQSSSNSLLSVTVTRLVKQLENSTGLAEESA